MILVVDQIHYLLVVVVQNFDWLIYRLLGHRRWIEVLRLLGRLVEVRLDKLVVEQLGQVGYINITRLTFRNSITNIIVY